MVGKSSRIRSKSLRWVLVVGWVLALAAALGLIGAGSAGAAPAGRVKPGKLATLVLSPAAVTIAPGGTQAYTAQGFDASGTSLGDMTSQTKFTISPDGSCAANRCTATTPGAHTVTGTIKKISGSAILTVAAADLAVSETVDNANPYYYAPVTFTTTVTNTSTTTTSTGVSATVKEPAGLVSPTAVPSVGSYDTTSGMWTIGSLAPGASATLTITGNAGDVSAGQQTVTATATAATFDPNPANNTASAAEASQPAPFADVITGGEGRLVDVCSDPPATVTWSGSVVSAINPDAPPLAQDSYAFAWACRASFGSCPDAVGGSYTSPTISYVSNGFAVGVTYTLVLTVVANPGDPNYQGVGSGPEEVEFAFTGTCVG